MTWKLTALAFVLLCMAMPIGGCTCEEETESVADKMTGSQDLKHSKEMKKQLKDIEGFRQKQADDIKKADGAGE